MKTNILLAAVALAAFPVSAMAHVVVAPTMAAPGATETLNFIVGHGCQGQPTTALRIEIPKAVTKLEPQPKTGWAASVQTLPDGGHAITWRGGEPLTKADGFAVKARLPSQGATVAFVAVQSCGATDVRWDEPVAGDGPKPKHPAPTVTLLASAVSPSAPSPTAQSSVAERLPAGVQRSADGGLATTAGLPLYTFNYDTMVGMSHCEDDCARMWPPLLAAKDAKPFAAWTLVRRMNGALQWALRDKPVYTYAQDKAGDPPKGLEAPNWSRAK